MVLWKNSKFMASVVFLKQDCFQALRNSSVMIEFSTAMCTILEQLNRDSFQNFELRFGRLLLSKHNVQLILIGYSRMPKEFVGRIDFIFIVASMDICIPG